ncbi:DNA polymerase-3 subunit gamma/tau [Isoptericola sp. CG 20/1183]|uniref:DNA polymerase-3 subunit gamma/tau n=1 Tax=Isoptericola halotolerans TaxID=300560 RepID=A0ABX5EH20_9MICO|nr:MULTISPECIES: hypothetical protein [Isoptericola]PRZ07092.1 DNA polymerase-3 subunit gamma/tau [Isoptericola halotolerans]PRZ07236.1 DNA polymerase-3 subunit gamma/tau [Isoptericola sp. CG 20/1183]
MKARNVWIVSGALGAVALGTTVAAAQGTFDGPADRVVSSAVTVGDATTGPVPDARTSTAPSTQAASPSPAAVQNSTSITTVTAGSVASATTAPTTDTPGSPISPVTATSPVSPATPQSAQSPRSAASAQSAQSARSAQSAASAD